MLRIARILTVVFLAGCSAALVPMSSDPRTKLAQARELMSQERALPAERLVREAIEIYAERKDEKGLGDAHSQYGLMLVSPAYRKHEKTWRDVGKYDPTAKTAIQHLLQSLDHYQKADDVGMQRFASFQVARLYGLESDSVNACRYYDLSAEYHLEAQRRSPKEKFVVGTGYNTWEEMIAGLKKKQGC